MLLKTVRIRGLVETSLLDWPGRLASVVFLPGCNLRCRYCHARDIILGARAGESIPLESVLETLAEQDGWLDGVVISGGEPTLCPGLGRLCEEIRDLGLAVKLDTNGTRPRVVRELIDDGLIDAVAMDVKAPLDYRYLQITQTVFGLRRIAESIELIMNSGLEYEFRTTVAPSLLSAADVGEIAATIQGAKVYALQPFRPHACLDRAMEELPPCPMSLLQDAARLARGYVENVVIRT